MVCFPCFVLTVFWCTTSYYVLIMLWKMSMETVNALAHRWTCACLKCVSGLRRLEKTLNFLRCLHVFDRVLKCGSDINERNWLQLLFYLIVLIGIVVSVIGMSFCSCVSWFRLKFSRIALYGSVCIWIPKVIWPRMDWFWAFCWKMASFVDFISVWTESKKCSIVILLWRHHFFSMFRLRGILVCSLKVL